MGGGSSRPDPLAGSVIFTFDSTHMALKAEQVLKQARLPAMLIPVPRRLSSLCGLALKAEQACLAAVQEELERARIRVESIHCL